jgi:short-subunit dehydrogenase
MCEALKPELEQENVALTLINPGFVETPLTSKNDFPMPFLVTSEEAAEAMYNGLINEQFEIAFPWKFAVIMKCLRLLPNRLFFFLTSRMVTR